MNEFSFEEKNLGDAKSILFINAAIRARRCQGCNEIYFVNDMHGEWTKCRRCRGSENKIEISDTKEDRITEE